jgi:hypothetical protein
MAPAAQDECPEDALSKAEDDLFGSTDMLLFLRGQTHLVF